MLHKNTFKEHFSAFILVFTVAFALHFLFGAWLWTYTINEWTAFLDKPYQIVWWQGGIMGIVPIVGQITIPVAVVTFVIMLIL